MEIFITHQYGEFAGGDVDGDIGMALLIAMSYEP
jgi:hypothetical protein